MAKNIERIIIIGGKGMAVALADAIRDAVARYGAPYELLGFAIDDPALGNEINGAPVLCGVRDVVRKYGGYNDVRVFYLLYHPMKMAERVELFRTLEIPDRMLTNFVHPSCYVAPSVRMGKGNVLFPLTSINSNSRLGSFNSMNMHSFVGHDTVIGNHNMIAAGAVIGSELTVGDGNFLGIQSSYREHVQVGDYNVVGMKSTVLNDIGSQSVWIGTPAKKLER